MLKKVGDRMTEVERRNMILKGNLWKTIILICVPLMVYQMFNSWYSVLDQIICASISTTAQNAVSSIAQIKNAISAFGAGLAAGGGVLVARYYGAGDVKNARFSSSNLLLLAIILSAILAILVIPLADPILKLCQVADDSRRLGINYFRLQMLELAFVTVNSVFIGLEKAKGNSKIVLILNVVVLVVKLGLSCLFVYGIHIQDIIFIEIATVIAQASLTLIGLYYMFRPKNILRLSIPMMRPKKLYVIPILKLAIPIFLGKFVMNLGKVVVNGMCGAYWNDINIVRINGEEVVKDASYELQATDVLVVKGSLIVGTLGISNNMSGLITSPTNSFEEAESSIVSQNLGNGNMKRAFKIFVRTFILATIVSIIGWALMFFVLINPLTDIFSALNSKDGAMEVFSDMIKKIFVFDSLSIPALGINAAVLGLLYGYGQTKLSTILNLSRIGSRIIILLILHAGPLKNNPTLCAGLSMGISNIIILVVSLTFLLIFLLHVRKKGYKGMYFTDPEPEVSALNFDGIDIKEKNKIIEEIEQVEKTSQIEEKIITNENQSNDNIQ